MTLTLNNIPENVAAAIKRVAKNKSAFFRAAIAVELEKAGETKAAETLRKINK